MKKKTQRNLWLTVIALLVLLILAALAWSRNSSRQSAPKLRPDANAKIGTFGDPAQRQAELDQVVAEGMLTISINATPSFADGKALGNLMIENALENTKLITVAIFRRDNGEKIYESGYLEPGQIIEEAPLDVDLEPGTYECTAYFSAYKPEDQRYTGQAAAEITVYVQG
ncbi:hypothetical protein [Holdemania massiliensis]|uniref:hypothetical protein n=1 Tax=Holdemania massiliensis TaxID=1468449 RepID=UPI001F058C4C|nr:hypothetical protein [Holdemania massiliensis]MCH1942159.1 hypothetical protein [Holdemania massiliensis]